jgi:hypothetical protein
MPTIQKGKFNWKKGEIADFHLPERRRISTQGEEPNQGGQGGGPNPEGPPAQEAD